MNEETTNADLPELDAQSMREQILETEDRPIVPYPCPEWGLMLFIKTMDGYELAQQTNEMAAVREELRAGAADPDNVSDDAVRARFLVHVLCDRQGNRVFNDPADIIALNKKSSKVLIPLFHKAQEVNGMGRISEDMVKILGRAQNSASGSDSPEKTDDETS